MKYNFITVLTTNKQNPGGTVALTMIHSVVWWHGIQCANLLFSTNFVFMNFTAETGTNEVSGFSVLPFSSSTFL